MRARLAPSADRTAISPSRVACTRVDQRADAQARNTQHQQRRQVPQPELRDVEIIRCAPEPHHARPEMRVRRRERPGRPFAEQAHLGVRLLPRDATRQPADDADRIAFERIVRAAERQWCPGVVIDRVPKALRHDTNHGRRRVPQFHDRTEDLVPAAERALPYVIAEHDHAGSTSPFVGVEEGTTEQGRHTRRAERGGGQLRHLDRLGRRVADHEVSRLRAVRPQVLDRLQPAPPLEEVAQDARLGLVRQGIVRLDRDEAVALGQWDRGCEDLPHHVVPACSNPDRNRERQSARKRQARVFQEHPEAELVVLQHVSSKRSVVDWGRTSAGCEKAHRRRRRPTAHCSLAIAPSADRRVVSRHWRRVTARRSASPQAPGAYPSGTRGTEAAPSARGWRPPESGRGPGRRAQPACAG